MKDLYKEENLYLIVKTLEDQLKELEIWSVYNEDKYNFNISQIKQLIAEIKLNI